MSSDQLPQLIEQLRQTIANSEITPDIEQQLTQLDQEIQRFIQDTAEPTATETLLDLTKAMETQFASKHPQAEAVLQKMIETLVSIGV